MVEQKAMYKITYGLFVLTTKDGEKDNGCIVNTVAMITDSPKRVTVYVNKSSYTEEILRKTTTLLGESRNALAKLKELDAQANKLSRGEKQAKFFNKEVVPAMEALRKPIDKLEMIVEKDMWPMPSYGDLIFEV